MLLTQMVVEITYKLIPFNPLAMGKNIFYINIEILYGK